LSLRAHSDPLPLKLADISCLRVKNNANKVALPFIFLVIFHLFDLLKRLLVGYLEFKRKGTFPGLQRQVNSDFVAHILGNNVNPDTGKIGIEYAGVNASVTLDIVVGEIIIGDA
jgi:hypothetical protein